MHNTIHSMAFKPQIAGWKTTVLSFAFLFFSFSIQLLGQNVPVAGDDENFTYQDIMVTGNVYDNDYDLDGDELTYSIVSGTPDGTWNLQPNGDYTYMPNQFVTGIEYLVYQVCDQDGMCTTATLTMYVIFLNDAPQANNDSFNAELNSTRTFNLRLNDVEPDNEIMLFYMLVPPANGTATLNVTTGVVNYTPNNGYTGTDSFIYQACDPCNVCDQAVVNINVLPANASPVFSPVSLNATEDQQLSGSLAGFVTDADNDNLIFGLITNSPNGSVSLQPNGNFTFTPQANFSGLTSFFIQACDIVGQCATAVVAVNVAPVNDSPIAQNDSATGNEDVAVNASVNGNDSDIDSSPLTYSVTTPPSAGSINMSSNGSYVFNPPANQSGNYTFTYQVCDSQNACASATVTITIQPVNDAPTAVADVFTTTEDNVLSGTVANDTDIDSPSLTYSYLSGLANGSIEMNSDGSFMYYPNENWSGVENATYAVCDNQNACSVGTFQITVNYVNDAPNVVNESFTTQEDNAVSGNLSSNDDAQGEGALTYSLASIVEHGDITINSDGTFIYTPAANWFGVETINYSGCNTNNACDGGTVTITVQPVNDAPVCSNASISLNEDSNLATSLSLVADVDNTSFTVTLTQGDNGTATINGISDILYTPSNNYFGNDAFQVSYCDADNLCCTATISVTIAPVNDTPITSDGATEVNEDTTLNGALPSASDAENQTLHYELVTAPMNGQINISSNGAFTYIPDPNYNGIDVFTFSVCDSQDACDAAVMTINVESINDLPIVQNESNVCPIDLSIDGSVAINDSDIESETLSYSIVSISGSGTIELAVNGDYNFTPAAIGITTIVYQACDGNGGCVNGTLTIETIEINTAPVANEGTFAASEDLSFSMSIVNLVDDNEGGNFAFALIDGDANATISISQDGILNVLGDANFYGTITLSYEVCDNGNLCSTSTINVEIAPVNDPPTATPIEVFSYQDQSESISLNSGISDDSNSAFTFELIETNFNGTIELTSTGTLIYTPSPYVTGYFDLVYSVCDEGGLCDEVSSQIYILYLNDEPQVEDAAFSTNEEQDYSGTLAPYTYEPDQEEVTYQVINAPLHGTLNLASDGTFTYSPDPEYSGFDQFTYAACDPMAVCAIGVMDIEVVFMNDLPVAVDDYFMVMEDDDVTGTVATNDIELDIEVDSYTVYTMPEHGTLMLNENGTFTYVPFANYYGMDEAWIMMCDPCGACDLSILTFEVTFINDMPIVEDESIIVYQNTSYSGSVADNDYELDIEDLTYFIIEDNTGGIFNLEDDGSYYFVPGDDALGNFTLQYMACDPCGACSFGTLYIEVIPLEGGNTSPSASNVEDALCMNTSITIDLAPYIFDMQQPDGDLDITVSQPENGFASVNGTTITYSANDFYVGLVTFDYEVCDTGEPALCNSASIELSIFPSETPQITDLYVQNVQCYGGSDGYIEILETESSGNVSIVWANGGTDFTLYNLPAGEYAFTLNSDVVCNIPSNYQITVGGPSSGIQAEADVTGISDNNSGQIALTISGGVEPYQISWAGASGSNDGYNLIDITAAGTYFATIEDALGCSIDTSFVISGIEEFGSDVVVRIWPNPAAHILSVSADGLAGTKTSIQIFNAIGQSITERTFGSWSSNAPVEFDLTHLAPGIYHVRIIADDKSAVYPFIKE